MHSGWLDTSAWGVDGRPSWAWSVPRGPKWPIWPSALFSLDHNRLQEMWLKAFALMINAQWLASIIQMREKLLKWKQDDAFLTDEIGHIVINHLFKRSCLRKGSARARWGVHKADLNPRNTSIVKPAFLLMRRNNWWHIWGDCRLWASSILKVRLLSIWALRISTPNLL